MRFGPVPLSEAAGAILAHSAAVDGGRIRKGSVLAAGDIERLSAAGITDVTVSRLDPDDLDEDAAAARIAAALVPDVDAARISIGRASTGRVNLHATANGVVRLDASAIDALNRVDPSITFASPAPFTQTRPGALVGTVKIIAYGVPTATVDDAGEAARGAISVIPVSLRSADLVVTRTPAAPDDAKGIAAIRARIEALGMSLEAVTAVPHEPGAIAGALSGRSSDLRLILTASATSDLHDVAPEGVRAAGGAVTRFGMPVDPGNLLFLGSLGSSAVIGLPGCARSPALNGADFVLSRVACGLEVGDADIAAMGVGGLLKEIPARGRPREA